jgi:hypothetical protein
MIEDADLAQYEAFSPKPRRTQSQQPNTPGKECPWQVLLSAGSFDDGVDRQPSRSDDKEDSAN